MSNPHIADIVADWDEVFKKGQLTLWVLLAIADGEKYAPEIAHFMYDATCGTFTVQEQSLYRALRRFRSLGLIVATGRPSPDAGPDRKYYALTSDGKAVLAEFARLNLRPLQSPRIINLINNL